MKKHEKVETIYHNGQADGIRIIHRVLSTMTAYVIPRNLLSEAKKLKDIQRPGIYFLISEDEKNSIAKIYIGQTHIGINRLNDHNQKKDFWTKAIMFLADKNTFTLDMINWLERYAIEKAHEAKRYKVENKKPNNYEMDEFATSTIETIHEEIEFIMATQGYFLNNAKQESNNLEIYYTSKNGIVGQGIYKGDNFVVLEGSEIDMSRNALRDKIETQRQEMLNNKQIKEVNGKYYLKISVTFTSPSSAAVFVLGGSQNGWIEWKNDNGTTLDEIIRKG